jgi:hypothetical protein
MRLARALRAAAVSPIGGHRLVKRSIGLEAKEAPVWLGFCMFAFSMIVGCGSGRWLDKQEENRMVRWRDQSALYKGYNTDPLNNPSWGEKEYKFRISEW